MLYSFSKSQRFYESRKILYDINNNFRCEIFYDLKHSPSRTTTFGFGLKADLSKTTRVSPPCNTYNLQSDFDPSRTQRKGFGFGKGRE